MVFLLNDQKQNHKIQAIQLTTPGYRCIIPQRLFIIIAI